VNTLYVVVEQYVHLFSEDVSTALTRSDTRLKEISLVFQLFNRITYLFDAWRAYSTSYVSPGLPVTLPHLSKLGKPNSNLFLCRTAHYRMVGWNWDQFVRLGSKCHAKWWCTSTCILVIRPQLILLSLSPLPLVKMCCIVVVSLIYSMQREQLWKFFRLCWKTGHDLAPTPFWIAFPRSVPSVLL